MQTLKDALDFVVSAFCVVHSALRLLVLSATC
jgi:hypothetical protein